MSARFYKLILIKPRGTIFLARAVTAFPGWWATKIELNNSIGAISPDGHVAVKRRPSPEGISGRHRSIGPATPSLLRPK